MPDRQLCVQINRSEILSIQKTKLLTNRIHFSCSAFLIVSTTLQAFTRMLYVFKIFDTRCVICIKCYFSHLLDETYFSSDRIATHIHIRARARTHTRTHTRIHTRTHAHVFVYIICMYMFYDLCGPAVIQFTYTIFESIVHVNNLEHVYYLENVFRNKNKIHARAFRMQSIKSKCLKLF